MKATPDTDIVPELNLPSRLLDDGWWLVDPPRVTAGANILHFPCPAATPDVEQHRTKASQP